MDVLQEVVHEYHHKKFKPEIIKDSLLFLLFCGAIFSCFGGSEPTHDYLTVYLVESFIQTVSMATSIASIIVIALFIIISVGNILRSKRRTYGLVYFPYEIVYTKKRYLIIVDRNTGMRFTVLKIKTANASETPILIADGIPVAIINVN